MISFVVLALAAGALAGFFVLRMFASKRGPTTALVRIGIAAGEVEAELWQRTLTQAGMWSRIIGETGGAYPSIAYQHELWVKAKDAGVARDVLGIDEEP